MQSAHVENVPEKWVPDILDVTEPLQGNHKILNNLISFQLDCEEHKPILGDTDQQPHIMRLWVATTLAANMTFNTINLRIQFPKQLLGQTTFSITHHWNSLFYQVANTLYYHNLYLVLEPLSINKLQDYVNQLLFTALNAVKALDYLAGGKCGKK